MEQIFFRSQLTGEINGLGLSLKVDETNEQETGNGDQQQEEQHWPKMHSSPVWGNSNPRSEEFGKRTAVL